MYVVYVVEDEKDLLDLLEMYLKNEGYDVKTFLNGEDAMDAVNDDVHLWLLDIMLSGDIDGFHLLKKIREKKDIPIIFMSARNQEIDRIMGLELGSDDYITKPFSPREVMLRISNVLKRVYGNSINESVHYGEYNINLIKRLVYCDDKIIDLTSKEMDLLIMFIKSRNQAFERSQILDNIWSEDYYGSDRVVDDLVKRLRKKMLSLKIETIYGYGYRLV